MVSQAFGAEKFKLCGKLYLRALYVTVLLMIPILILMIFGGNILNFINR